MTTRTLLPSSIHKKIKHNGVKKKARAKKFVFASLVVVAGYCYCSTSNIINLADLEQRARQLLEEREKLQLRELITIDKGGGACDIGSPVEDAPNFPAADTTRTLVTSYPGSGKRFTWTVVKALTNYEVADDWDFSGKLNKNPLVVKTSFPHREGR